MDSNINDFIEIILDCRGLTIHDYPHMSAKICTHPDDYFALISGLRLPRRKESYCGRRRVGSSLVVLGRCRGEIAHKSLTTRTLLQKHGPGARSATAARPWFIALTWTMREIFWRVRFVNHGSSAVHTLHAPIERRAPAKYHERREGGREGGRDSGKCTYTRVREKENGEQMNGRAQREIHDRIGMRVRKSAPESHSWILCSQHRSPEHTVLILFSPQLWHAYIYLRDSKWNNDVVCRPYCIEKYISSTRENASGNLINDVTCD